ncbi:HAD family hydrolase [Micromonospora sp. NPDC048935]|uniref:HAD family hydrolase n=1 Tax=Micromonospora sp. NPDC048935 TaxID=3364262 RepID=UPI003711AF0A
MIERAAYGHVLFDFDGVLCDSAALSVRIYRELRDEFPDLPEVGSVTDLNWVCAGPPGTWLAPWLGVDRANAFWRCHEARMTDLATELGLFPHIGDLLLALPAGSVSIVTGARAQRVRQVLTRCVGGVPASVASIAGAEDTGGKVEKVRRLLARRSPVPSVYVGDTAADIICGRAVPVDVVAVGYGYQVARALDEHRPTWHVESPERLAACVRSWHRGPLADMP